MNAQGLACRRTLKDLEARWRELDSERDADEVALLDGQLDKADYIVRDLARQAERKELEFEAAIIRRKEKETS